MDEHGPDETSTVIETSTVLMQHPFPVEAPPHVPSTPSTAWVSVVTQPSNAAARLVEAVQREDLSREQIAQAVVENTCHPGVQTAVASFLDRSQRQSLHRFCTAVRSMDPVVLDKVVDLLCNKVVSAAVASQAHLAMEEQRQRARLWRQQHEDMHEHHMDMECR